MKHISIALVFVFAGLYLNCAHNVAGNSTQTGNPTVSAMLYNPGGSPAVNASVHFFKSSDDPRNNNGDSTETDNHGNYAIHLDTGVYNIIAHGDSGMAFQDSIKVIKGDTIKPHTDTLKAPGTIKGVVQLQPGDDARTVFILFMGTHTFTLPSDDTGHFTTDNMAAGTYNVRILTTTPNYKVLDTSLTVSAGTQSILHQPIMLQYTGIPVPTGLTISYDTLKQLVALTWNKPTNGRTVQSYTVYRKRSDSTSFGPLKSGIADTIYRDSTAIQDQTYNYRVAAVDIQETEGVKSVIDSVTIQPAFFIADTIFKAQGQAWIYAAEIDAQGNYVVVNGTAYQPSPARIERYSPSGTLINSWNIPDGVEEQYVFNCLAVGDSNTIFAITKNDTVIRYDTAGKILTQFQYPGTAEGISLFADTVYRR
jgi:hypothetical protein